MEPRPTRQLGTANALTVKTMRVRRFRPQAAFKIGPVNEREG
jgi:hypothetical protein